MRTYRSTAGPFAQRPYFTTQEIEHSCLDALQAAGLLPTSPNPIRVDRFAEKQFRVTLRYEDLEDGLLGYTRFGKNGVEDIIIARTLDTDGSKIAERRIRSTIAHEAGHGLFHTHLFVQAATGHPEFADMSEPQRPKILCRDVAGEATVPQHNYHGKWWEYHANQAIGALLLPRQLVAIVLDSFLVERGKLGSRALDESRREVAVRELAEAFNVNPAVARIRIKEMFSPAHANQLEL